jgi:hypothetical protein
MESELGDQDIKSITQVNSHDDALEVLIPHAFSSRANQ